MAPRATAVDKGVSPTERPGEVPNSDGSSLILEDETESREAQHLYATTKDLGKAERAGMVLAKADHQKRPDEISEQP